MSNEFPHTVKLAFAGGMDDVISGVRIVEIDGKPYVPASDNEERLDAIKDVLIEHQTRLDMLERIITSVISGQDSDSQNSDATT